jgi:hypothetical protein
LERVERRVLDGHSRKQVRRRQKARRAREAQVRFALGRRAERRRVAPDGTCGMSCRDRDGCLERTYIPTEDEESSGIFGSDLRAVGEEKRNVKEKGEVWWSKLAHPRDICARKTEGRLRPFWYKARSHESSASASSASAPIQIP